MDIRDLLRDEHRQLQDLAGQICETRDPLQTKKLFFQLKDRLVRHARAKERVVYDALSGTEDREAMTLACEGAVKNGLVDRLVQQNTRGRADNIEWRARMRVIRELVDQHVTEEERETFDALAANFTRADLEKMAERFEEHKVRVELAAERARDGDPQSLR